MCWPSIPTSSYSDYIRYVFLIVLFQKAFHESVLTYLKTMDVNKCRKFLAISLPYSNLTLSAMFICSPRPFQMEKSDSIRWLWTQVVQHHNKTRPNNIEDRQKSESLFSAHYWGPFFFYSLRQDLLSSCSFTLIIRRAEKIHRFLLVVNLFVNTK